MNTFMNNKKSVEIIDKFFEGPIKSFKDIDFS